MQMRIGSRESALAIAQTETIKKIIEKQFPNITVEIVTMKTLGDRILDQSLEKIGGKGLFIEELQTAMREDRVDFAVHSLKDMPMEIPEDLPILAFSKREDPRDVLVLREELKELPQKPLIGTSSRRRKLQMQEICPEATFTGIRGNVQTRLRKLKEEQLDGTILAAAGLKRLQKEEVIARYFDVDEMIPAAGQGILALQGKDTRLHRMIAAVVNDEAARFEALAERAFVRVLDGGCTSPVAAHATVEGEKLTLRGLYFDEETGRYAKDAMSGPCEKSIEIGEQLAEQMRKKATSR